jgi:protein quaking
MHIMSVGGELGSVAQGPTTQSTADYLAQLLKDKKQLAAFPNVFLHMERLLDDEIAKVRGNLFQINGYVKEPLILPEGIGPPVVHTEKVYVPSKDHPEFNFVGRILGPRGLTAKQLEQETGCKVMIRGRGSMRDKKKEEANRGKPNWEHLNDELHVLITVEDCDNRAKMKLERAVMEVKKLLTVSEGEDELKKRQLMELAIINGTYRDSSSKNSSPGLDCGGARLQLQAHSPQSLQAALAQQAAALRGGTLGGAPLILSPRLPTSMGGPPPLINPQEQQLLYTQCGLVDYSTYAGLTSPLIDYTTASDNTGGPKVDRRVPGVTGPAMRQHPYTRP